MIYCSSDWHGFPLGRIQELLDSAGFGEEDFLFVLGDVIDRNGDGGVELLRWLMMQPNVELLLGNHEAMLLSCGFLFEEVSEDSLRALDSKKMELLLNWVMNGAEPTIKALTKLHREDPGEFADLLAYLRGAPLYDAVSLPSGDFILTHSGLGNFSREKKISQYEAHDLLWNRPEIDEDYFDDMTVVFGHTPTRFYGMQGGRALRTRTWIDIDTGASGGERPMLLRLDDMREFYLEG